MKLDDLKNMNIPKDNIVEFCFPSDGEAPIKLGYYGQIVESIPKHHEEFHETTPFLEIYHGKEKHGVFSAMKEYPIKHIKWLVYKGKSSVDRIQHFIRDDYFYFLQQ